VAASSGRVRIAPRASAALTTAQRRPSTALCVPRVQLRVQLVTEARAPKAIEARAPAIEARAPAIEARAPKAIEARARTVIERRARKVTVDRGPSGVTIGAASVVMTTVATTAPRR
jgi:hypothetical protein